MVPLGAPTDYGYVSNQVAQTVPIEADVTFDSSVTTSSILHTPGGSQIGIDVAGAYEVRFTVSGVEPNQFALFANGAPIPGSVYGSGAGTQQNVGTVIVQLAAGDVLTLRNHSSSAAVTLQTLAGGTQSNVNASLTIQRLPDRTTTFRALAPAPPAAWLPRSCGSRAAPLRRAAGLPVQRERAGPRQHAPATPIIGSMGEPFRTADTRRWTASSCWKVPSGQVPLYDPCHRGVRPRPSWKHGTRSKGGGQGFCAEAVERP